MKNHDWYYDISQLKKQMGNIEASVQQIKAIVKPEEELWDNADIIKNWKLSARTLADWRTKGLIGYVQAGNKIWYPREAREDFIKMNFVQPKLNEINDRNKN